MHKQTKRSAKRNKTPVKKPKSAAFETAKSANPKLTDYFCMLQNAGYVCRIVWYIIENHESIIDLVKNIV